MAYRIESVEKVSASGTASDVSTNLRDFFIENLTADVTVYFKEKNGVDCTENNGFAIGKGVFDKLLRANTLSIIASDSADVRILYVKEE